MQNAVFLSAIIAVILLVAALLVVWTRRDVPVIRASAVPMAIVGAIVATVAVFSALGQPVPLIAGITAPPGQATVLSAKAVKGEGIYVTFDLGLSVRLYWLPWNTKMAEQLQEMFNDPGTAGVTATIPPFEWSWDIGAPTFQPLPQPKWMPDKPAEDRAPMAPHFSA